MTNSEIKLQAEKDIEKNFDGLLLFSVFAQAILLIANAIPIAGRVILSPINISVMDVFSRCDTYKKVNIEDFKKYFIKQWHTAYALEARSLFYILGSLLFTLVISLIFPVIFIVTGFVLFFQMLFAIGKSFSCAMGYYILYKNPNINSKDALNLSIKLMQGNRWRLFCLCVRLFPQIIYCLLLGYGLPQINRSMYIFYDEIYAKSNYQTEESNEETVCPKCGEVRKPFANYCGKCGYNFNEVQEETEAATKVEENNNNENQ